VAGRRFDLIASNPPFVLTPPAVREAGLPLMEYRDAGGPILPTLVAGLGKHLEPGGSAVMLGNWEHRGAASWREVVAAWLPEGLDAWILERELQDPVEYATMWLRDGGLTPERDPRAFDAALPPAPTSPDGGPMTHRHTFTVKEQVMPVGAGVTQRRLTFNGQVPGPVLRGKVGDTFEIPLVNDGTMSHSLDFHAGITPPDQAMRSINPGESLVYTFTAQHSGIWLYHCSTSPMSLHLAAGMHGAVIIDPPGLAAVDREYVIVASEVYLGPEGGEPNTDKIAAKTPDLMTFNGVAFQYHQQPLKAKVGERVRFWVMAAGPSLPTSFHTVGLQFDQVFFEGAWTLGGPNRIGAAWSGGSQALGLQPAQGGFVECVASEPGHYVFVTHSFAARGRGARGARCEAGGTAGMDRPILIGTVVQRH